MACLEARTRGVPDFGPVVDRAHLLNVASAQSPALTVICAAAGYGKSVLAAQLVGRSRAEHVLFWVPLLDSDVRSDEWLSPLGELFRLDGAEEDLPVPPTVPLSRDSATADGLLRLRDHLARFNGRVVHIVLDGVNHLDSLASFEGLARMLRKSTHPESTVTVTCRFIAATDYLPDPSAVWVVGDADLRFDVDEVKALLGLAGETHNPDARAVQLLNRFDGHPALTSLMLRHARIDDQADPPLDLVWHTKRLVAQLPDDTLPIMYCSALLREGSLSELEACLTVVGERCDAATVAQLAAPLLSIVRDSEQASRRFRVHAVLCDAVIDCASRRLGGSPAAALRASILSHLIHAGDYSRLQRVLLTACEDEEIARCCEQHGMKLLHYCGAATTERCLGRVAASRVSASARLLLLRAATLRESECFEEAITHASLARRIAEADGDSGTQVGAVMIGVRSAIDSADLAGARSCLRQLQGTLSEHLDSAACCLRDSYAAGLEAYAGNSLAAQRHLANATASLERMDKRSPEASWAANSISAVQGQMLGRWDLASALSAAVSSWSGLSPMQRLQSRANTAAALLETGSLEEAQSLLEGVLADSTDSNLRVLHACALGTLADVTWWANQGQAHTLFMRSQRELSDCGEYLGLAAEQMQWSMLRRASGLPAESLALAESSVAQLRRVGRSADLFRLAAEIEVGAAMLSLGDPWGARRLADRIARELDGSVASAHVLSVSLLLAELERREGDLDSAISRLTPSADYIATGSANWRIAAYVRAFPGLLGLLAAVVDAENLPLRMLRLLPSKTVEEALESRDNPIHATACEIVAARCAGCASESSSISRPPESSPAACRVRLFGGLEVTTQTGVVEDACWRKRKVRLLFAMLAARCGQDLPRDVILERLWPDMDEERARRNFYVTWSAMKRALANGEAPSKGGELVRCAGGVCRVTRRVRTDLEDFDDAVQSVRTARVSADLEKVITAGRQLCRVYRGDLLPGDVYEDWFTAIRDRTRHDFCDAMMIAARTAENGGEYSEALLFLHKASAADPWREDIYQSMMRCQMNAGQRSRAIETYIACRGRLVEDLGIDPSSETTRLYETVLAMESDRTPGEYVDIE